MKFAIFKGTKMTASTKSWLVAQSPATKQKTKPRGPSVSHKQSAPSTQQGQANMTIATPKPVADAISKLDAADRGEFLAFSRPVAPTSSWS